jgi:microcystin-dependent protein
LRGRAPMHTGSGPGLTSRVVGETGGAPTVTLSSSELPPHTHGLSVAAAADGVADRSNAAGNVLAKPADPTYATGAANAAMSAGSTAPAGGNGAHNNMQPYLVINFFIALQGIFPPRP